MRNTMAGLVTAVLAAVAGVAVAAPPAHAGGFPVRVEQPSAHDTTTHKSATAGCPHPTQSVFAAGFEIVDADGGVVPTGMVPDSTLRTVTVTAAARTGYPHAWSLVAYAICDNSGFPPFRVAVSSSGASTVTATCPGQTRLTGTGFGLPPRDDGSYLDEVSVGPGLRQLRVHAGGPGIPASLTGYAICKQPTPNAPGQQAERVAETSAVGTGWPKSVSAGDPTGQRRIYGVGGMVEGGGGQVFLSALVPDLAANLARVQAVWAQPLPAAGGFVMAAAGTEDEGSPEGSVTGYGILIGTFH